MNRSCDTLYYTTFLSILSMLFDDFPQKSAHKTIVNVHKKYKNIFAKYIDYYPIIWYNVYADERCGM